MKNKLKLAMIMVLRNVLTVLLFFSVLSSVKAQHNLTLYNMNTLPQRIGANPASVPDSKLFIGFPGISSLHLLYNNDGFRLKEGTSVNSNNQLEVDVNKIFNDLKDQNRIGAGLNLDLLNIGFAAHKNYFSFGAGVRVRSQFTYPKDFIGLFVVGNSGPNLGRELDLGIKYDLLIYNELFANWSREIVKDKFRLGAKLAYLQGIGSINTERSNIKFRTDPQDFHYTVKTDIKLNTSGIATIESDSTTQETQLEFSPFKNVNNGFALSFGGTYKVTKKIDVSASVVDLGFIDWKKNVRNFQIRNTGNQVDFYGIDLKNYINDSVDLENAFNELLDTLEGKFPIDETEKSYRTQLPTTFYLGANYWLNKNHNLGVLLFGNYYQKKFNPAITLSYNGKLTRILGLSLSYSILNNSYANAGLGFTLNAGPVQIYAVSDNMLGLLLYKSANTIDFRTGINFTFRRKSEKRKKVKPEDQKEQSPTKPDAKPLN